jgi:hypothetical protein
LSIVIDGASPHSRDVVVKMPRPMTNSLRRPKRSASGEGPYAVAGGGHAARPLGREHGDDGVGHQRRHPGLEHGPLQRPLDRARVGEVAHGELDVVAEHVRGPRAIADERAHGHAAQAQRAHDVCADGAGRSCHEYFHRIPPRLGGMLAFKRKTLAGS